MAEELLRSRHAFGSSKNLENVLSEGKVDAYDILFLDGDTDNPKIGWVDKNGNAIILADEKADLKEVEASVDKLEEDFSKLDLELSKKADAETVNAELNEINKDVENLNSEIDQKISKDTAEYSYEKIKYEISDVPVGTLIKYLDSEIRIMCPSDSSWVHQSVGEGGDKNCYYATFNTYVPNDDVVGYVEHLGDQVDKEILTNLSTDKYGRKYQQTWLAIARYDETTNKWTYYGSNSSKDKYIGWDYQIDWYDTNNVKIASDCIRINLSNEDCHSSVEPYYVSKISKEIDARIDEKISEANIGYEIIEF